MSPGLRILVISVAASMLSGQPLFAMPPSRAEVNVVVAGSDRSFAAITKSLTESLSFIGVTAQFERAASVDPRSVAKPLSPQPSLLANLWIDAAADRDVILYITDATSERVFVRRLGLEHALDKVAVEGLAFVAQSSLEALLAGKLIGMTRDDYEHSLEEAAPRPAPKPAPTPPPHPSGAGPRDRRFSYWQVGAGYELQAWDGSTMRHAATLGIDYEKREFRFALDLFGTLPLQFHSGDSGATLISSGARLSVARPLALPHQLRLVPGLGFALELTHIRPELSSPVASPASAFFAFDPTIRAVVGIERSWGRWSLRGILGLDFMARPVHYVVTRDANTEVVRTPWQERPFAAIVLAARL
ncbi:MAG: hypothetical protein WCG85_11495 [Polyangia bacterium]